jgi:hypothetical protein
LLGRRPHRMRRVFGYFTTGVLIEHPNELAHQFPGMIVAGRPRDGYDLNAVLAQLTDSKLCFSVGPRRRSAPQVYDLIDTEGGTRARLFTVKTTRMKQSSANIVH